MTDKPLKDLLTRDARGNYQGVSEMARRLRALDEYVGYEPCSDLFLRAVRRILDGGSGD